MMSTVYIYIYTHIGAYSKDIEATKSGYLNKIKREGLTLQLISVDLE